MESFIPVGILLILALIVAGGIYFLTTHLGPRNSPSVDLKPYECGVEPDQSIQYPFPLKYYLVAVLFLLFDIEAAFFLPWALVYKESLATNATLFLAMIVYLFFFVLALIYVYRKGYVRVDMN